MKITAKCFVCPKEYNVTGWKVENGKKCECGGYIISPSGKMQFKVEGLNK